LHDQNGGAKKRKLPTKIRSKLEILKRDEVEIDLVENNLKNMTLLTRLALLWWTWL
jgi:hypothetical protein